VPAPRVEQRVPRVNNINTRQPDVVLAYKPEPNDAQALPTSHIKSTYQMLHQQRALDPKSKQLHKHDTQPV
jgi:hypothetical protein